MPYALVPRNTLPPSCDVIYEKVPLDALFPSKSRNRHEIVICENS